MDHETPPSVQWPQLLRAPGVQRLIDLALAEDIDSGDVTTEAIFSAAEGAAARVVARRPTVVCGIPLAAHIIHRFDAKAQISTPTAEGAAAKDGDVLLAVEGDVRALLTAERCVLNFLMHLCGVASAARAAQAAIPEDCKARIFDTRKTIPGLRLLDKAAVKTGGAFNHRMGLHDAVLIKDNHIAAAGSITEAVRRARHRVGSTMVVEVEIDRLDQLDEALATGPDIILLDNFSDADMATAVRRGAGAVQFEASGGVTLDRVAAIAKTGVDRISMGGITHSALPADLSMEFLP